MSSPNYVDFNAAWRCFTDTASPGLLVILQTIFTIFWIFSVIFSFCDFDLVKPTDKDKLPDGVERPTPGVAKFNYSTSVQLEEGKSQDLHLPSPDRSRSRLDKMFAPDTYQDEYSEYQGDVVVANYFDDDKAPKMAMTNQNPTEEVIDLNDPKDEHFHFGLGTDKQTQNRTIFGMSIGKKAEPDLPDFVQDA